MRRENARKGATFMYLWCSAVNELNEDSEWIASWMPASALPPIFFATEAVELGTDICYCL